MTDTQSGNAQTLRNLANSLRDQHRQLSSEPRLPAASDQDILRAMLGKPWKRSAAEPTPSRKAG